MGNISEQHTDVQYPDGHREQRVTNQQQLAEQDRLRQEQDTRLWLEHLLQNKH